MKRMGKMLAAMSAGVTAFLRIIPNGLKDPFTITLLVLLLTGAIKSCGNEETDPPSTTSTTSGAAGDGGGGAGGCDSDCGGGSGGTTTPPTGGTGGVAVCHPGQDPLDPNCENAQECVCTSMPDMPSGVPCPGADNQENSCTPGHNTCGCDMEEGEEYAPPDPSIVPFLDGNGDIWEDENGNQVIANTKTETNNQTTIHLLVAPFGSESDYYDGLVISGFKVRWNRKNEAVMESGEGEFSFETAQDGTVFLMLTVRFYDAGNAIPYSTQTARCVYYQET